MILTRESIEAFMSYNGKGVNGRQLALLGITDMHNWKNGLIGRDISDELYNQVLSLKGKRAKTKKKKRKDSIDYGDLLLHKSWRSLRSRILERDNHECTKCGSKDKLNVHHTYYLYKKTKPWLYPENSLITLCGTCHIKWHVENENVFLEKHIT